MVDYQKLPLSFILNPLIAKTKTPYDPQNTEHVTLLTKLWYILKNNEELTGMISNQWSDIGFQGKDPSTDFRGMGLLGLENLIYFSQKHRVEARDMITREYPFAVTGINITHFILGLLKPKLDGDTTPLKELMVEEQFSDGFVSRNVIDNQCFLFEELYCIIFRCFDYIWRLEDGTYFRFGEILKMVEAKFLSVLSKKPKNYSSFVFLLDFDE
jgi:hypothetical protein